MIENFNELAIAIRKCAERIPEGTLEECHAWADADPEVQHLRYLHSVWVNALDNPPEGVVGVGAIVYAEHKLREAQQNEAT
jgi:hypothetical protein